MGGMSPDPKWITIVGIVGDIRHAALDVEPKPEMYVPFAQDPYKAMIFAVRTHSDRPASTAGQFHPLLADEAAAHASHQAAIRRQGGSVMKYIGLVYLVPVRRMR